MVWARIVFQVYTDFVIFYFFALNSIYFALNLTTLLTIRRQVMLSKLSQQVFRMDFASPISLLVPAYNENLNITESVRGLLLLEYPRYEVIVINDGSKDDTLSVLMREFQLVPTTFAVVQRVPSQPIRAVYHSPLFPNLVVVDKVNGGKADALNAGINLSRFPLICAIDADSIVEKDALSKVAWPFLHDPERVIASGGTVRIVNGSDIQDGRVVQIKVPPTWRVRFQVVEYLRAFLLGRHGWGALRMLLIISGAFGVFRKEAVIAVGGYRVGSMGEDMELVVRLHRHYRAERKPYRVVFVADPVCWTEAPEDLTTLRKQRNRWHRGLLDTLWIHRSMFMNPKYGLIGLIAFPYFVLFELFGPVVEMTGYVLVPVCLFLGWVNMNVFWLFMTVAILYGVLLSFSSVLIEEISFHKYERMGDLFKLFLASILENFGYRQLNSLWRLKAFVDYIRGDHNWGEMNRKGFQGTDSPHISS